ncbi:MAG: hypothetical protein ACTSUE_07745 [Promethearchaeota archaeon]
MFANTKAFNARWYLFISVLLSGEGLEEEERLNKGWEVSDSNELDFIIFDLEYKI